LIWTALTLTETKTGRGRIFPIIDGEGVWSVLAKLWDTALHSKDWDSFDDDQKDVILLSHVFQNINHNNFARRCWKKFAPLVTLPTACVTLLSPVN
jgi:hypothetical protein